jgi:hypothetical protein
VNPVLEPGFAYHHLVFPTTCAAASDCGGGSELGVVGESPEWFTGSRGGALIGTGLDLQQPPGRHQTGDHFVR